MIQKLIDYVIIVYIVLYILSLMSGQVFYGA